MLKIRTRLPGEPRIVPFVPGEASDEIAEIARSADFPLHIPFCTRAEMIIGIRGLDEWPRDGLLSEQQQLALLENLRNILTVTALASNARPSLLAQSRLPRWMHLREVSGPAAEAYAGVLRWAHIEVPEWLLP